MELDESEIEWWQTATEKFNREQQLARLRVERQSAEERGARDRLIVAAQRYARVLGVRGMPEAERKAVAAGEDVTQAMRMESAMLEDEMAAIERALR